MHRPELFRRHVFLVLGLVNTTCRRNSTYFIHGFLHKFAGRASFKLCFCNSQTCLSEGKQPILRYGWGRCTIRWSVEDILRVLAGYPALLFVRLATLLLDSTEMSLEPRPRRYILLIQIASSATAGGSFQILFQNSAPFLSCRL